MSDAKQFNIGGIPIKVKDESARGILEDLRNNLSFGLTGAGIHNSFFRGKCLGNSLTDAQKEAIANGTFDGMYIGDFWTISSVNWRIGHFNYWLNSGDKKCKKHHVLIVPDSCLYVAQMHNTQSGKYEENNEEANTTEGGYINTDMYKTGLNQAKTIINNAFGEEHILSHRELLTNAILNGNPYKTAMYDSTVELMNEPMVYGTYMHVPGNTGTIGSNRCTIELIRPSLRCLR